MVGPDESTELRWHPSIMMFSISCKWSIWSKKRCETTRSMTQNKSKHILHQKSIFVELEKLSVVVPLAA